MADYPLINGLKWDYSSLEIDVAGDIYVGIKEIAWTETLEPGIVRGTSAQKLARTRGEHDAEGSMVMYYEDALELLNALGDGYGEVSFDISVTYSGEGVPTKKAALLGCRITSKEITNSQGTDPSEMSFDLDIIQIEEDGLRMVANALI